MRYEKNTIEAFLALLKRGLWAESVQVTGYRLQVTDTVDWKGVYNLASEQSVLGLLLAGLERSEVKPPKPVLLQWIGEVQLLEQRNQAMNYFIGVMVDKMKEAGIETTLVKGQGVAQCYERPLWRSCGDVDFLLDEENYQKAKGFLLPLADTVSGEHVFTKHQALNMQGTEVELHGRLPFMLSRRVDNLIDAVLEDTLHGKGVTTWILDGTDVLLPNPDNHVIIIFTHFLHHFFIEGVGLRQICDWCRLLWVYRDSIDRDLLEKRLRKMGLMSEWKVFASLVIEYLGMPLEAMPLYEKGDERKASRVLRHVIKSGNFGHNNDVSYRGRYGKFTSNVITFFRRLGEFVGFARLFPADAPKFFVTYVSKRVRQKRGAKYYYAWINR